jgi:translation initiation factor IF-3
LIGDDGERLGVLPIGEALQMARERDLDLVEVAPNNNPPVCRLLDYGKFMYEQAKRDRGTKHQHHGELREVRFKVKIGQHDMDLKARRAEKFLREGDKVKLSVMFRGREIIHPEIGQELLNSIRTQLEDIAVVEKPPTMEGRFMNMILGPGPNALRARPEKTSAKDAQGEAPKQEEANAAPEQEATNEAPKQTVAAEG